MTTISCNTPPLQPPEETKAPVYCPTPISGNQLYTLLYPLLKEEQVLDYLRMEDSVSKRPPEGEPHPLILKHFITNVAE